MGHIYYKQLVEGVTIPAIIHNGSYFLIQMAVYENGTVSCWHKSDLAQFQKDLQKGWVVAHIPLGEELSIGNLGSFPVCAARWSYDPSEYFRHVEGVVRSLNPDMENLYHATQQEQEKWQKAHVQWTADPIPCKLRSGFGYRLIDGESGFLFYRSGGELQLTTLTAYADKTLEIGSVDGRVYTVEEVQTLFSQQVLCTSPKGKEWVHIDGLGEILLAPSSYGELPIEEKQKEIIDTIARLSGEQDTLDRCREAHYQYLIDPNDWTRENLRKAYEAVPKHQRMFLGDMDTKDGDFIRILYDPDRKREV